MEKDAFPSDQYAIQSQIGLHGFEVADTLIEIGPRKGEKIIRDQDIIDSIEKNSDELALIYLGGLNYYTGQAFDMRVLLVVAGQEGLLLVLT